MLKPKVVLLIFVSGKIVLTGAKVTAAVPTPGTRRLTSTHRSGRRSTRRSTRSTPCSPSSGSRERPHPRPAAKPPADGGADVVHDASPPHELSCHLTHHIPTRVHMLSSLVSSPFSHPRRIIMPRALFLSQYRTIVVVSLQSSILPLQYNTFARALANISLTFDMSMQALQPAATVNPYAVLIDECDDDAVCLWCNIDC
jgi:hypothetical protein